MTEMDVDVSITADMLVLEVRSTRSGKRRIKIAISRNALMERSSAASCFPKASTVIRSPRSSRRVS